MTTELTLNERREELHEIITQSTLALLLGAGVDTHFGGAMLWSAEPSKLTHRVTTQSAVEIAGAVMALSRAIYAAKFEKMPAQKALEKLPRGRRTKAAEPTFKDWFHEIMKRRGS